VGLLGQPLGRVVFSETQSAYTTCPRALWLCLASAAATGPAVNPRPRVCGEVPVPGGARPATVRRRSARARPEGLRWTLRARPRRLCGRTPAPTDDALDDVRACHLRRPIQCDGGGLADGLLRGPAGHVPECRGDGGDPPARQPVLAQGPARRQLLAARQVFRQQGRGARLGCWIRRI
jgi:hypothetical protein